MHKNTRMNFLNLRVLKANRPSAGQLRFRIGQNPWVLAGYLDLVAIVDRRLELMHADCVLTFNVESVFDADVGFFDVSSSFCYLLRCPQLYLWDLQVQFLGHTGDFAVLNSLFEILADRVLVL